MMTTYPVRIRMSRAALEELENCEYGSYEDHIAPEGQRHSRADIEDTSEDGSRCGEYADGTLHIVEIIQRSPYKTVVYLENQAEVDEFFGQACTGTFGLYHLGTCLRIYRELEPHVSEKAREMVNPGSIGY